ncbi:hypothetical protein EJ02DRAFT_448463 [Clathrospora elynae]|uniref:CHRD domain-containing protein n=1 Tax=Clathrospora elynae TaxID=706981 RepID=A0A6A5S6K7_9PLEO|nr:hypothetical protein EJ02DRAFT_448463 [Clathrospora elynae]
MKTSKITPSISIVLSVSAVPITASPLEATNGRMSLQININLGGEGEVAKNAIDANQLLAFSSTHFIQALPDQVVNGTEPTGGIAGASGHFNFGINTTTATHIHEAAHGASGPPRILFPNPEPVNGDMVVRNSAGWLKGPFLTGVMVEGKDSGEGFHVSTIEAIPASFMADTHSSLALLGAVRGQLT